MNTMLRVLVIVITLLGVTALVFAILNFNKRQILLGRNKALVEEVTNLAKTVEAQDAKDDGTSLPLGKDVSEVTDLVLDNPDKKIVFENYPVWLETQNLPFLSFDSETKQIQLNTYYATEEVDGKVKVKVDSYGQKVSKGPGTMQELLDQLLERTKQQHATLNKTRAELSKMRELATENIEELNKQKNDTRVVKRDLTTARGEIAKLEGEKADLERTVAKLTTEKRELEAEVADMTDQIERLKETEVSLTEQLATAKTQIEDLLKNRGPKPPPGSNIAITAGDKGKVIESNDEFKFVIIEFSPDAMMEILGAERDKPLPQVDMNVRRIGRTSASGDFVTQIKLRHSVKGKNLVVADIMTDWQQSPVEKGDVVFF